MSTYWLVWLLGAVVAGFAIPEAHAIKDKQKGDTLSENVQLWLRTDTPGGGASWLVVWSTLAIVWFWFLGHIMRWWQ